MTRLAGEGVLRETALAKINLTLQVLRRREDGLHALSSLVAFASVGDQLRLAPGETEELAVLGPQARALSDADSCAGINLVMRACDALRSRVPGLRAGRFSLEKHLPVASGIGGGSADAAAALRLLARLNGLAESDPRLHAAAMAVGADVPVCIMGKPRMMSGIGEVLGPPLAMPRFPALLVNPGVETPTAEVFRALGLAPGESCGDGEAGVDVAAAAQGWPDRGDLSGWLALIGRERNDLAAPAQSLYPVIGEYRDALAACSGCMLARMSGSGATVFGLFSDRSAVDAAARLIRERYPRAWIASCLIGEVHAESNSDGLLA